jgi:hypothetical protein
VVQLSETDPSKSIPLQFFDQLGVLFGVKVCSKQQSPDHPFPV